MKRLLLCVTALCVCSYLPAGEKILVPVKVKSLGYRTIYKQEVCTRIIPVEEEVVHTVVEPVKVWINGCCFTQMRTKLVVEKQKVDKEVTFMVMKEDKEPFNIEYTSYQEVDPKCPAKVVMAGGAPCPAGAGTDGHAAGIGVAVGGGAAAAMADQSAVAKFQAAKSEYEKVKADRERAELEYNKAVIDHGKANTDAEKVVTLAIQESADKKLQIARLVETASANSMNAARNAATVELLKVLQ